MCNQSRLAAICRSGYLTVWAVKLLDRIWYAYGLRFQWRRILLFGSMDLTLFDGESPTVSLADWSQHFSQSGSIISCLLYFQSTSWSGVLPNVFVKTVRILIEEVSRLKPWDLSQSRLTAASKDKSKMIEYVMIWVHNDLDKWIDKDWVYNDLSR